MSAFGTKRTFDLEHCLPRKMTMAQPEDRLFAAPHESASGTNRTCQSLSSMSAFDPKRTWGQARSGLTNGAILNLKCDNRWSLWGEQSHEATGIHRTCWQYRCSVAARGARSTVRTGAAGRRAGERR